MLLPKEARMNTSYISTLCAGLLGLLLITVIRFSTMQGGPIIDLRAAFDKDNVVDILIIGSGPAGLQAAVYGGRAHHNTWVLEGNEPGGLLIKTTIVENWPGEISILGKDIINNLKMQAEHQGAQFLPDTAARVDFSVYPYVVYTEEGRVLHALSIIIATGATPKKLGVPGEEEFWGHGVTNCAVCDAPNFEGLDVVVVGGGDAAVEEALQVAPHAASVTIMVRGDSMRAVPSMKARLAGYSNIKIRYNVVITEIEGKEQGLASVVTQISVRDTKTDVITKEPISGVFLAIGQIPNTWVFRDTVSCLPSGHIRLADQEYRTQKTSVPGVFVAGDVADVLYRQAGVAAGDGTKAALDADEFLRERGYNEFIAQQLEDRRFIAYNDTRTSPVDSLYTIEDFNVRAQEGLMAIDFYAEYCPSCLHMLPVVGALARQYADRMQFFKINIEESPELAAYLQVERVPTFMIFRDGNLVSRNNKVMTRSELRLLIDHVLTNV
jgi:thioredoxin reductase (NADPH)